MVQDIVEYNRHCELYRNFKSKAVNEMDDVEGSAQPSWDDNYHKYANGLEISYKSTPQVMEQTIFHKATTMNGVG